MLQEMKKIAVIFLLCIINTTNAQKKYTGFFELSTPKKLWVMFHPFKAKKAFRISEETNKVSDSIRKTNLLDKDASGGQVDAFRHAFWMARLRQELGKTAARSLGKAHERENYKNFKKRKIEDGIVPDEISSIMDLHNNEQGLALVVKGEKISQKELILRVLNAIKKGKMRVIKKDANGNFLTCNGKPILRSTLKGKWKNNKCLIPSNPKT